ncbi:PspC domain-containing protein [Actinomadura sp. GC306]|uniref:PspC domain-containing protein n=1 Tax=Actinomadura sp. GC306 TaxID=2530367 RepID=UPI00104CC586|nr:PspC domain-containing protein [Actinomadura sp. GC306]TDC62384.1 PspC domain-containing protein [Actinomadura sp. GC306]
MDMEKNTNGTAQKQLRRTHDGRMVAGVCSGAGHYLGIDANIVRLGLAVFTLFGGAGIALYVIAWLLMPEEGAATSIAEDLFKKAGDSPTVQDAVQKSKNAFNKDRTNA